MFLLVAMSNFVYLAVGIKLTKFLALCVVDALEVVFLKSYYSIFRFKSKIMLAELRVNGMWFIWR